MPVEYQTNVVMALDQMPVSGKSCLACQQPTLTVATWAIEIH
jgi:hypothetical protein